MTKLISALIVILVCAGAFEMWSYWEKISNEKAADQKQQETSVIQPEQLAGLPRQYEPSLKAAQAKGAAGLKEWLKMYGKIAEDPRKGWIELDYVVAVARENPADAKKVFADVKARTPESSPIISRIKLLAKTYE